jgi:pyrimidine oxygenase
LLISTTSPRYKPSFALNRDVVRKTEAPGFEFVLSMFKLRDFGSESEFWDECIESCTLMAASAAVTDRIKLFASSTMQIMRDLWETGSCDLDGEYFKMTDCRLSPRPGSPVEIVAAGQGTVGMDFAARYADYRLCMVADVNTPTKFPPAVGRQIAAAERVGRDVGAYAMFMIIADEAAQAKWDLCKAGKDMVALSWMGVQAAADERADFSSTAKSIADPVSAVNFNIGTLVGSYATVARLVDELATVPGVEGIMLTFDDFIEGINKSGGHIMPLIECRKVGVAA